jgi:uncharacterized protein
VVIEPPAIYQGHIVHVRNERLVRTFRHRLHLWYVDAEAIPVLPFWLRPFARFLPADHLGSPDRSIRANVDHWLGERGIDLGGGQVTMLTSARVLGYVFNPLTVFWCHAPDNRLACVIAEVANTHDEHHCYLLLPDGEGFADVDKEFFVSPFFEVEGAYRMRLPKPGKRLSLTVALIHQGRTLLTAVLTADRHGTRPVDVVRLALTAPLMPQRVAALIRWHGIALWLRRVPIVPRNRKDSP